MNCAVSNLGTGLSFLASADRKKGQENLKMHSSKKMRQLSLAAMCAAGLIASRASTSNAATITVWNYESLAIATNNTPAPSTGTGTSDSIGMDVYPTPNVGVTTDDVLVGKSSDTGANAEANTTHTWRVRAQAGANGAANGWSDAAPIGAQGAQFFASTVGYNTINISFDWYSTTQGEANLQLEYTTDSGAHWTNAPITIGSNSSKGLTALTNSSSSNTVNGSYISDNLLNNGSQAGQDWFQGLTASISDPLAANNAGFGIELVNASTGADDVSTQGTALNDNSGNWRFDNIAITGTALPEPCSLSLLALGGAALIARRRRQA
jgi:hypothetical protein